MSGTFGHVEDARLRAYLEDAPGGMTHAEALDYSADCLEADIRADESGMECAPPIDALNARELAYEAARRAAVAGYPEDIRSALRSMWEV
jgi:hypothetical protein